MTDKIQLNNISLVHCNKTVLDDVNYTFYDGIYLLRGGEGAGKTALLKLMAGFMRSNSGEVITAPGVKVLYLFQEDLVFDNLTVKENLYIKSNAIHSEIDNFELRAKDALKRFEISSVMNYKVSLLSGGEKKRLQMAVMLMMEPDVILLDDIITRANDKSEISMIKEIEKVKSKKTVIIASRYEIGLNQSFTELELYNGKLKEVSEKKCIKI